MKNPIGPSLKTEWHALSMIVLSGLAAVYFSTTLPGDLVVAFSRDGESNQAISWTTISYIGPVLLSMIYLMFIFFPYLKINHREAKMLKADWHKAKDMTLSFFFIMQVVGMLVLSGNDKFLIWAAPILFALFLLAITPIVLRIVNHQKNNK